MSKRCWVYWLHLETHTDIATEGYVGITTLGVEERYRRHVSASKRLTGRGARVRYAISKHSSQIVVTTLLEGSVEYCQYIENRLRPRESVGWNLAIGGAATAAGRKNSEEHIRKVAEANKGRKRSSECVSKMRKALKAAYSFDNPWEHPYSNKQAWALASDLYDWFVADTSRGRRSASKEFNIPVDSVAKVLNRIKSGWIPSDDSYYMGWLKTYKHKDKYAEPQPV